MRVIGMVLAMTLSCTAQAQLAPCGDIDLGARDYRGMTRAERMHIEGAHFTPQVEALKHGKSSYVGDDLDYTLRHIPNHPRALASLMRYGAKLKSERIPGAPYSVSCYFERALRFAPDDPSVRYVAGRYALSRGDVAAARAQFEAASNTEGLSANVHYNLGLSFLDVGDVERVRHHARLAYEAGGQPEGLARRLKKLGPWPL